jgi:DNA-binding transcriptional LysR family regulator
VSSSWGRLSDLRIGDVQTFLAVRRWGSITAAARALHVTPSQVSKAVARLEEQTGFALLTRGARGVTVSASGQRILGHLEEVVRHAEMLRTGDAAPELIVVAPSFLNALLLPVIAIANPALRLRGIELPPTLLRVYAAESFFDMALTLGPERFPDAWISAEVGEIPKVLFAPPEMARALGPTPVDPEKIRDVPFVCPVYNHNGQFLVADDGCPLGADRRRGHEVQTIGVALAIAEATGQLVFGPRVAGRAAVQEGRMVEIAVKGWDVRDPAFLACNGERMLARAQREVVAAVRAELCRIAT